MPHSEKLLQRETLGKNRVFTPRFGLTFALSRGILYKALRDKPKRRKL